MIHTKTIRILLCLALLLAAMPAQPALASAPATWYVTTTGSDSNTCATVDSPCATIQAAIAKATAGDTIMVASGQYFLATRVVIDRDLTISGGWGPTFASQTGTSTLSGQHVVSEIITVNINVTAYVDHLILTSGLLQDAGAILNNGNLTVTASHITNNIVASGGWSSTIANIGYDAVMILNQVTIDHNGNANTYNLIVSSGNISFNDSVISDNTVRNGSFIIQHTKGQMELNRSTVKNNSSSAIEASNTNSAMSIDSSTIAENGGTGVKASGPLSITNSTISGNFGSGIWAGFHSSAQVNNSTITANHAYNGGGIYTDPAWPPDSISLQNTILSGNFATNSGPDCIGTITSAGHNLLGNNSGCDMTPTTGDIGGTAANPIQPRLSYLGDNGGPTLTHALLEGSPAVDAGSPDAPGSAGACLAADQRGIARPAGTACDIGAYEGALPAVSISGHTSPGTKLGFTNFLWPAITADSNGDYFLWVPKGWNGTVQPYLPDYGFTPEYRSYTNIAENQIGQDFVASRNTFFISGSTGVAGTTIHITGNADITTDASGNYSFKVSTGWTGTVTPSKVDYSFTPPSRDYSGVNQDITSQDFTPTLNWVYITGTLSNTNTLLTYVDGSVKTAQADTYYNQYSIKVPIGWSGTITPSLPLEPSGASFSFAPASRTYTNLQADQVNQDYIHNYNSPVFGGDFENGGWYETSTNFGSVSCKLWVTCGSGAGTAGPHKGIGWAWFGGIPLDEIATASQSVGFATGHPNLKLLFYLWTGTAQKGADANDVFQVKIDNQTVFSTNATEAKQYSSYTPVMVDVSSFADAQKHILTFTSNTTGQLVTFNLDDVSITDIPYTDVMPGHWALTYIQTLQKFGITGGCAPGKYCPAWAVTRDQMAVFLLRAMHGNNYTPPPATGIFSDVPVSHWAAPWIEQLAAEGITGGCAPGKYCPAWAVTRDQMAVFLLRAIHGRYYNPGSGMGKFKDVPPSYWASGWIEQLAAEGITSGCTATTFCPNQQVTRDQMAVFLVRAFGLK